MNGKLLAFRRAATPEVTDEALVAACGLGDSAALGTLFDRHRDAVRRFLGHLATSDARDLDDLVQSTFLEVFRGAKRYRGGAAVRTWMFAIAFNVSRRHARGEIRRKHAMSELRSVPRTHVRSAEVPMLRAEQLALLARAIRGLPDALRVVFVMCDVEHVDGPEAARTLGLRPGTLWRRLHDARKRLRAALEEA